jgi:hypothetical protein
VIFAPVLDLGGADQGGRDDNIFLHRPARQGLEQLPAITAEELGLVRLGQPQNERVFVQPHEHVAVNDAAGIPEYLPAVAAARQGGEFVETDDKLGW